MLKKLSKFIAVLTLVSMMATMIAGCGSGQETADPKPTGSSNEGGEVNWITAEDISDMPETTIRYWFYETPERIELGEKQVKEFQDLYPNIKVEGSTAPDNTDTEMLMPFVQSRTNSNIHQSVNNEDPWYIDNGLLYPLNNFPDFEEVYGNHDPALNYTWIDGNVYSMSWYNAPMYMFYNTQMVEAAGLDINNLPETYSEFYEFAEKLTDPANKKWAMVSNRGEEWWQWQFVVYPLYVAAKGDSQLVSDDGKSAVFNNDAGIKSLEFFDKLTKEGWAVNESFATDPFISNQAGIVLGSAWNIPSIINDAPPDFEYEIGPIPRPDGVAKGEFGTYSFVRNFCIIDELGVEEGEERDRVRRASWEFMKFLLNDEQHAADFAVAAEIPAVKDIESNEIIAPVIDQWGEDMKKMISLASQEGTIGDINTSMISEVHAALQKSYLKVVIEGMDPAEAIALAEEEANTVIAEGR